MYNHWKCQKSKQSENDVNDKACKLPKNMNINNSIFPVERLKIAFWNFLFKVKYKVISKTLARVKTAKVKWTWAEHFLFVSLP